MVSAAPVRVAASHGPGSLARAGRCRRIPSPRRRRAAGSLALQVYIASAQPGRLSAAQAALRDQVVGGLRLAGP
jgi:hypothetical protein